MDVRSNIRQFNIEKELLRLKQNYTKAETTSVLQDIQKCKQIKSNPDKLSPEEVQRQIENEFGVEWGKTLSDIHQVLSELLQEDEESKLLFNSVKNVTKHH